MEQRLEQQVQQQVVAPDVHDERDRGTAFGDIREVLIRSDADVGAPLEILGAERGQHLQVRRLVRDQVVGIEVAAALRERRDRLGELREGLLVRARLGQGGGRHEGSDAAGAREAGRDYRPGL